MKLGLAMERWTRLLNGVGAQAATWEFVANLPRPEMQWTVDLQQKGLDVDLSDVDIDYATQAFTYRGRLVTIYIKDTRKEEAVLREKESAVRIHFSECQTIQRMKDENRYQRYVAIARTDGLFPVFARELDGHIHELEVALGPCKHCLADIDYRGYSEANRANRSYIWLNFSVAEYFKTFASRISIIPRDACSALPDSVYTEDWSRLSHQYRAAAKWRCSECGVNLSTLKQALHVHHKSGDKSDNRATNLVVLCAVCHAKQPGHAGMFVEPAVRRRILELRAE